MQRSFRGIVCILLCALFCQTAADAAVVTVSGGNRTVCGL